MKNIESSYLELMHDILETGESKMDRTGTGTLSVFGRQMRADLSKGFPLLTTKKVSLKSIIAELLWFIEGSGDERRLAELMHGTRDTTKKTIWTANAQAPYWKPKAKFDGDLGRIYGVQWRDWTASTVRSYDDVLLHDDGSTTYFGAKVNVKKIDQLAEIVNALRTEPTRRMILSAWNPGELDQMALPPCHAFAQFNVRPSTKSLDCQLYIRSNDMFLGAPFNIASYALLVHMLAQVTGHQPGELVYTIGDAHIYQNHIEQVKKQLSNSQLPFPTLRLNPNVKEITDFTLDDFELIGYQSHDAIPAPMAV